MTSAPTISESLAGVSVIPVVVIDEESKARDVAAAVAAGGILCAEITLRTAAGLGSIARAAGEPGFTVGAGTVTSVAEVERVHDAGARFIVSPGFDEDVVDRALDLGLAVLPGVATATEIQRARRSGLDVLKLFPADRLGGSAAISAFGGPFPDVAFVPSGGVSPVNAADYLALPSVFAVSGSWMATRQLIRDGDFDAIARLSAEAPRR